MVAIMGIVMFMESHQLPVGEILTELGRRLRTERLNQNMTQQELADRAGVSVDTVRSIESAGNATLAVLAKMLRALGLDERLQMLVPSAVVSPIQVAEREGHVRERASGARSVATDIEWHFADAPHGTPPGTT
jgi:transcriptional regulator with XRE-family HTH domain